MLPSAPPLTIESEEQHWQKYRKAMEEHELKRQEYWLARDTVEAAHIAERKVLDKAFLAAGVKPPHQREPKGAEIQIVISCFDTAEKSPEGKELTRLCHIILDWESKPWNLYYKNGDHDRARARRAKR